MGDDFPPRGHGVDGGYDLPASERWKHPQNLGPEWNWQSGKIKLGQWRGREFGPPGEDNRHIVTVAGSRSGKTRHSIIPNLRLYPGSAIILDPKGELVAETLLERQHLLRQNVYVLDPFRITNHTSSSHNPFDELGKRGQLDIAADAAQIADAMIIAAQRDNHWTDAARNYIRGLILYMMIAQPDKLNMKELRRLLHQEGDELDHLLYSMANTHPDAFNSIIHNVGTSYKGKFERAPTELQSIFSTAQEQTSSFDDVLNVMDHSDFDLADLRMRPTTVYLVLPALRMGTHFRWLRLFIQQAFAALEKEKFEQGQLPVWFVLEEFATLGFMRSIETATGFMAGMGIKLWTVLQDLSQLKTNYPRSWQTFLGNAGIIQAFGNSDLTTTEHLSKRLGNTRVYETQDVFVSQAQQEQGDTGRREHIRTSPLLEPSEITRHFARENHRQMIIHPGSDPVYMGYLPGEGQEGERARADAINRRWEATYGRRL